MTDAVRGFCDPRFAPVRDAFAASFADGLEAGAAVALEIDGEPVLDLWGGARTRETGEPEAYAPWTRDTLVPVFSTTKAVTALVMAWLVEQGALDYEQTVASLWPDFAQNGKGAITVAQALSHQAGLPGFRDQIEPTDWFDWGLITSRLAAAPPMWGAGEGSGYHPITFGFLAGEIARRVSGRSIGEILRTEFATPFDLDIWIGLPEAEHGRVAQLEKPRAFPEFGKRNPERFAAFIAPWASPGGRGGAAWRMAEFAGANGHATARGLARILGLIANGGMIDGHEVLSGKTLAALTKIRVQGPDRVLPFTLAFGAGVMRNLPGENIPGEAHLGVKWGFYGPSPNAAGHSGWGGSCAFADPDRGLSFAYTMNRQSAHLIGDPRPMRLIRAVYDCL